MFLPVSNLTVFAAVEPGQATLAALARDFLTDGTLLGHDMMVGDLDWAGVLLLYLESGLGNWDI